MLWGIVKTLLITTQETAAIKSYKYSEGGCMITLCYFLNTSPGSIINLVRYWEGNNIMAGVNLI